MASGKFEAATTAATRAVTFASSAASAALRSEDTREAKASSLSRRLDDSSPVVLAGRGGGDGDGGGSGTTRLASWASISARKVSRLASSTEALNV
jgi:hypothetical protein